ncbi:hypothetical protein PAPYR_1362 [Paratrimastix pyriformis]|uniref:Uncharacterized protein n=1 Tax=Paratrimastix pyriformis TaxID=342808 RepID=A0ABQ8USR9_9EUKA|nr:hypothetical protein PAPYR_1362 [Paratrimastix pyriformis]
MQQIRELEKKIEKKLGKEQASEGGDRVFGENDDKFHFLVNIAVIGTVDKTDLLIQHIYDGDPRHAPPELVNDGIMMYKEKYEPGKVFEIHYWDYPGTEELRPLTMRLAQEAAGTIYVYDVNDSDSYHDLASWMLPPGKPEDEGKFPKILIGMMTDEQQRRVITQEEAEEFANAQHLTYFEVDLANPDAALHDPFVKLIHMVHMVITSASSKGPTAMLELRRHGIIYGSKIWDSPGGATPQQRQTIESNLLPFEGATTDRFPWLEQSSC